MNYVQYNVNMACMTTFSEIPQVYKRDSIIYEFQMARILSNCLLIMLPGFKTFKESVHKMGKVYCCDSGIRLG